MVSLKGLGSRNLGSYVSPRGFSCRKSLLHLLENFVIDHSYELLSFNYKRLEKWSIMKLQLP